MEKASKGVAWVCILSTLLMGCYTSEMIDPTGTEKERLHANKIKFVLMRDGTEYKFYDPPSIANDTLTGRGWLRSTFLSTGQQVSLPMSDVAEVSVSRYDPQLTLWACVGGVVVVGGVVGIVVNDISKNGIVRFGH